VPVHGHRPQIIKDQSSFITTVYLRPGKSAMALQGTVVSWTMTVALVPEGWTNTWLM
jgi:hypothetical protein